VRVRAVIESMTGARFVHDTLEELGWEVLVADAQKVKGLAPLACKTDKIDARVLAELSWRDLVPAIWLPDPSVRREHELARYRLHLVRHRTTLKNRIHATLTTFGHPCPVSDLFGYAGRELLDRMAIPDPWRRNVDASLALIDDLELQIAQLTCELKRQGADHRAWTRRRRCRGRPVTSTSRLYSRKRLAPRRLPRPRAMTSTHRLRTARCCSPPVQARPRRMTQPPTTSPFTSRAVRAPSPSSYGCAPRPRAAPSRRAVTSRRP
jgi:hypothetical protein